MSDPWAWSPRSVVDEAPNYRQSADTLNLRDPFNRDSWRDALSTGRFASAFGDRPLWNVNVDGVSSSPDFSRLTDDNPFMSDETFWSQSPFGGRGYERSADTPSGATGGWGDWGGGLPGFNQHEAGMSTRSIFTNNTRGSDGKTIWEQWGNDSGLFPTNGGGIYSGGKLGTTEGTIGEYSKILDGFNDEIAKAVQQVKAETGIDVPANLVKSMLYREGGGKGDRNVTSFPDTRPEAGRIYAFNGIFESTAASWGIDWSRMIGNDEYAIYALTLGLTKIAAYQYNGVPTLEGYGWEGVAMTYFGGKPVPGFVDELGNVAGGGGFNDYVNGPNGVITMANKWDQMTGGSGAIGTGGMGTGAIGALWGNAAGQGQETQGFGLTDWALGGGAYMYDDISPSYWGYEGGHNGRDYAMTFNSEVFSPVSGTIIQAGGSQYGYGPNGPGVAGEGELKIRMADGSEVVIGHMSGINVTVGMNVTAGQLVGKAGYMMGTGGPEATHIHLETYKKDPTHTGNPMNLRVVDPVQFFAGVSVGGLGAQAVGGIAGPRNFHDYLMMGVKGLLGGNFAAIPGMMPGFTNPNRNFGLYTSIRAAAGNPVTANAGTKPVTVDPVTGKPSVQPNTSAAAFIDLADNYIGTPYSLGGLTGPTGRGLDGTVGWDCSGMVSWLGQQLGMSIPNGSHEQYNFGTPIDQSQLQPGDLVFFNTGTSYRGNAASHVAIYLGNGQMIHAMNPNQGTLITDFANMQSQYMGARRIF